MDRASGLRAPGAILLLSCYELGRQPTSLASPLASLVAAGFAPEAIDLSIEPLDPERVARAGLVAVSVPMHTALRLGTKAVAQVRALNPGCRVVLYGLYATLNAGALFARGVDCVIGGEYEEPLVRLAQAIDAAPAGTAERAAGQAGRLRLEGVSFPGAAAPPWLRRIPFAVPRRDRLPRLERYARLERDGALHLAGQVEASRGCLHVCRHCPVAPVYGGRFFVVPREVVLADARQQVASGATHLTFGDPDFLNGPKHALAIVRALHAEHPDLTFDFTAKVEHLLKHRALLAELAASGCLFVISAVESVQDDVLAILDKGHTRADVETLAGATRAAGIALRPTFLPFTPWTSLEDYRDLLEFIARHGWVDHVDPIQLAIRLLLPPGSLLLGQDAMRPHLDGLDAERFTWRWRHPDPRMDALHAEVTRIVARDVAREESAAATFARVAAAAGARLAVPEAAGRRPPRMTEPWFCCAEPTGALDPAAPAFQPGGPGRNP